MLKKYSLLIGIIASLILLGIATLYYPGGSQFDKNAIGYSWKKNYLSNLFSEQAVNGTHNASRPWAVGGMFFICMSFALFFWRFSKKIPLQSAANIVRYVGVGSMLFTFLIATPLHDIMVTVSATGSLITLFYITVFTFRSKLLYIKVLSIAGLLVFYTCACLYYTRSYLELLPVMQKLLLFVIITWILCLEYFTTSADFQPKKTAGR